MSKINFGFTRCVAFLGKQVVSLPEVVPFLWRSDTTCPIEILQPAIKKSSTQSAT
jgi:hypothetical protein